MILGYFRNQIRRIFLESQEKTDEWTFIYIWNLYESIY